MSKKINDKCSYLSKKVIPLHRNQPNGGLAQLARALAWHARGHRFEPDILHTKKANSEGFAFLFIGAKSARQWLR